MSSHVGRFCLCGATFTGDVWPPEDEPVLVTAWQARHHGDGHGETSQSIARTIRRHKEQAAPGQMEVG